jgi:hypothetical protein
MRYPHAIWKGANDRNFTTSVHVIPRFWAVHVAQGAAGGTINWFHNPNAQVSSHFLNPKVGPIDQFVDTYWEAYAEMAFNGEMLSVEHEGFSGEHLNNNQMDNLFHLVLWGRDHPKLRIPPIWRPNAFGKGGVVSHSELGVQGGNHPGCPGLPIIHDVQAVLREVQRHHKVAC